MPLYEYYCEANQRTVEVVHPIDLTLRLWGEVCYAAQIGLGTTDPAAPVRRILTAPPGITKSFGNSELKGRGFTKLVKRDAGVYENVTATGSESRYVHADEVSSMPRLHEKIED